MKNSKKTIRLLIYSSLLAIVAVICGCVSLPKTSTIVQRISQPPAGKALVNFHRPSNYGGAMAIAIFDGNGKMLVDLPGASLCQRVCDPGENVFITWADHVTVVKADLSPYKIYDIMVDVSMGWVQANIVLIPLTKQDARRSKLAEFEKREKQTMAINPDSPRVAEYEAKSQQRIQQIKKDFLSGEKSDRVKLLSSDDCR
jgi:hypothetical protein